jgi:uncharacterized membrane protein YedE/YeeE
MEDINSWLITGGLSVGILFGVLVQRFRFCMVAATANWILIRDTRQVSAFVVAFLVCISGAQYLELAGWVPIENAVYRDSRLDWLSAILGGGLFGIGTTFAGGCAARTLIRSMEGSLHSLLALISFMLFAALTQFGFLESVRLELTRATALSLSGDAGIASILSIPHLLVVLLLCTGLLAWLIVLGRRGLNWSLVVAGALIGGLVVISWLITGNLTQDELDPRSPSAITMAGPLARIGYLIFSGSFPGFSFAISFVIGAAVAGLSSALLTRDFKIVPVRKGMARYAILGGALMGIGGILAYGCNIGQGLSGMSTLSVESLLATVSMFTGAAIGVIWWDRREAEEH